MKNLFSSITFKVAKGSQLSYRYKEMTHNSLTKLTNAVHEQIYTIEIQNINIERVHSMDRELME